MKNNFIVLLYYTHSILYHIFKQNEAYPMEINMLWKNYFRFVHEYRGVIIFCMTCLLICAYVVCVFCVCMEFGCSISNL